MREEAILKLFKWVREDYKHRCMLVMACDEDDLRLLYTGSRHNLVESLTASMLKEEEVLDICKLAIREAHAVLSSED